MTTLEAWLVAKTRGNERHTFFQTPMEGAPPPPQPKVEWNGSALDWGKNVEIFAPPATRQDAAEMNKRIAKVLENVNPKRKNAEDFVGGQNGHFSDERHALLFKPGTYAVDVQVGYYTQVLGLGKEPADVTFTGAADASSDDDDFYAGTAEYVGYGPFVRALDRRVEGESLAGSLNTFWRSVENVRVANAHHQMVWAVSQAAPMRRVEVVGDLVFFDATVVLESGSAYASGGFAADVKLTKPTDGSTTTSCSMGSQQQFFLRNCTFDDEAGVGPCAWSLVTCGCKNVGTDTGNGSSLVHHEPTTKVIAEKPFITWEPRTLVDVDDDDGGAYLLHVPRLKDPTKTGVSFGEHADVADVVPFEYVFYADVELLKTKNLTKSIQSRLDDGYCVVFGPGIFVLERTLDVTTNDQVLLGVGLATLKPPTDGSPAIRVAPNVQGVRIAGLTLQASKLDSNKLAGSLLLDWGSWQPPPTEKNAKVENPGVLSDVFARVGGPDTTDRTDVGVDVMIRISSHGVIGDNLWLWRADHSKAVNDEDRPPGSAHHLVQSGEFPAHTALEVIGDDVTIYGLACEHAIHNITHWFGKRGTTLFYQCELPYDVSQTTFGYPGFAGYVVDDNAEDHYGAGIGVYSFFRDHQVIVKSGIKANASKEFGHKIINAFTRFLDKKANFGILNVINNMGGPSYSADGPGSFPKSHLPL